MNRFQRLLAALVMMTLLCAGVPVGGAEEGVAVSLAQETVQHTGTVRVYLSSLGNPSTLTLTLTSGYTAVGNTQVTLQSGQQVSIGFNKSSGQMTMTAGGQSYAMGKTLHLKRHATDQVYGMKIAQSRIASNVYPGDLVLTAKQSGSAWRLYPVMHVYMEDYLTGVVPYEMGNSAPLEALKAQAVAARTYTINRMNQRKNYIYDLVDTTNDQVYNGNNTGTAKCTEAVLSTAGLVLHYGGKPIIAYYSASNGGQTESAKNAWGSVGYDYLTVRDDPFDRGNAASVVKRATVYADNGASGQNARLKNLLQTKAQAALSAMGLGSDSVSVLTIRAITPHTPKYSAPSVLYTKMDFAVLASAGGQTYELTLTCDIFKELESILNLSINSSQNELWTVTTTATGFTIEARRFGHGIGMSQRGAMAMGQQGYRYDQILGFYYVGCELVRYDLGGAQAPAELPEGTAAATVLANEEGLRLALLSAPQAGSTVLTGLLPGSMVEVHAIQGEWTLVSSGQLTGYVATASLQITGEPTSEAPAVSTVTQWATVQCDGVLNLRSAENLESSVQATIPDGEVLCVDSVKEGWASVYYGALRGYVATEFLMLQDAYPLAVYRGTSGEETVQPVLTPTTAVQGTPAPEATLAPETTALPEATEIPVATPAPMLSPEPTAAPEASTWAVVSTEFGSLNLRIRPQRGTKVLRRIPKGEVIPVLSRGSGWVKTSYDGKIGYVQEKYLTISTASGEPVATPSPSWSAGQHAWVVTEQGSLNLRQKASTSSALVDRVPMGAVVTVLEERGDWCYITYGKKRGYVQSRYLSHTAPTAPVYDATLQTVENITAVVDSSGVTLRAWCEQDAPERASVPGGAMVTVLERGEVWCSVAYGEWNGYCMTNELYLTEAESSAAMNN